MTLDKSDGGGTSVGPLGFWLIDVRSPQETPPMVNAAQTLRILYRIVAPFSQAAMAARTGGSRGCVRSAAGRSRRPGGCRYRTRSPERSWAALTRAPGCA